MALFRHSPKDAWLGAAALLLGVLLGVWMLLAGRLAMVPSVLASLAFAACVRWGANTISHNHIHAPLFRSPLVSRLFSLYLTLLLGVPQQLWRSRHLWHHAGERKEVRKLPLGTLGVLEILLLGGFWLTLVVLMPRFFWLQYLPGYLLGMLLCQLQGIAEHDGRPVFAMLGVSHYGALHNWLWCNDGYHIEHHLHPGEHWSRLPLHRKESPPSSRVSQWPPLLRFLPEDGVRAWYGRSVAKLLDRLEGWALHPGPIQRLMLRTHARAMATLLQKLPQHGDSVRRVAIVGGGLFPRSLLILAKLLPHARFVLIDQSARHLAVAERYLRTSAPDLLPRVELRESLYEPSQELSCDLLVIPLAYLGDRQALYQRPQVTQAVLVHDWLWRRGGDTGCAVSLLLLKRLNLRLPDAEQVNKVMRCNQKVA